MGRDRKGFLSRVAALLPDWERPAPPFVPAFPVAREREDHCPDCGCSMASRPWNALRCVPCSYAHQKAEDRRRRQEARAQRPRV